MYFTGFSEQRQSKQRRSEREKVNIEETQFRPFNTYDLISSVYRSICVYRVCSVLILIGALNVNKPIECLQAASVVPRMITTCCNLINLNFQQLIWEKMKSTMRRWRSIGDHVLSFCQWKQYRIGSLIYSEGILNRGERNTDLTLKALTDVIDSNDNIVRRLTDVHEWSKI